MTIKTYYLSKSGLGRFQPNKVAASFVEKDGWMTMPRALTSSKQSCSYIYVIVEKSLSIKRDAIVVDGVEFSTGELRHPMKSYRKSAFVLKPVLKPGAAVSFMTNPSVMCKVIDDSGMFVDVAITPKLAACGFLADRLSTSVGGDYVHFTTTHNAVNKSPALRQQMHLEWGFGSHDQLPEEVVTGKIFSPVLRVSSIYLDGASPTISFDAFVHSISTSH